MGDSLELEPCMIVFALTSLLVEIWCGRHLIQVPTKRFCNSTRVLPTIFWRREGVTSRLHDSFSRIKYWCLIAVTSSQSPNQYYKIFPSCPDSCWLDGWNNTIRDSHLVDFKLDWPTAHVSRLAFCIPAASQCIDNSSRDISTCFRQMMISNPSGNPCIVDGSHNFLLVIPIDLSIYCLSEGVLGIVF